MSESRFATSTHKQPDFSIANKKVAVGEEGSDDGNTTTTSSAVTIPNFAIRPQITYLLQKR